MLRDGACEFSDVTLSVGNSEALTVWARAPARVTRLSIRAPRPAATGSGAPCLLLADGYAGRGPTTLLLTPVPGCATLSCVERGAAAYYLHWVREADGCAEQGAYVVEPCAALCRTATPHQNALLALQGLVGALHALKAKAVAAATVDAGGRAGDAVLAERARARGRAPPPGLRHDLYHDRAPPPAGWRPTGTVNADRL